MDEPNYGMSNGDIQKYYVQKYDLNGKFLGGFGSKGNGDGQFLHAHNIAVDSQGNIYVTDEQRMNVQKFDSKGNFLLSWGAPADENLFSHKMEDVNVDKEGNVWVVNWGPGKLMKLILMANY